MKTFERIKLAAEKLAKKTTNISTLEELKFELNKKEKDYRELTESFYELKGKRKTNEDSLKDYELRKQGLLNKAKLLKSKNDMEGLQKAYGFIQEVDSKISMLSEQNTMLNKLIDAMDSRVDNAKNKIDTMKIKVREMETKEKFAKDVEKFSGIMGDKFSDGNMDELVREIETTYNKQSFKLEDIEIEDVSHKSVGFDEFIDSL